jgi:hypothetical protein
MLVLAYLLWGRKASSTSSSSAASSTSSSSAASGQSILSFRTTATVKLAGLGLSPVDTAVSQTTAPVLLTAAGGPVPTNSIPQFQLLNPAIVDGPAAASNLGTIPAQLGGGFLVNPSTGAALIQFPSQMIPVGTAGGWAAAEFIPAASMADAWNTALMNNPQALLGVSDRFHLEPGPDALIVQMINALAAQYGQTLITDPSTTSFTPSKTAPSANQNAFYAQANLAWAEAFVNYIPANAALAVLYATNAQAASDAQTESEVGSTVGLIPGSVVH